MPSPESERQKRQKKIAPCDHRGKKKDVQQSRQQTVAHRRGRQICCSSSTHAKNTSAWLGQKLKYPSIVSMPRETTKNGREPPLAAALRTFPPPELGRRPAPTPAGGTSSCCSQSLSPCRRTAQRYIYIEGRERDPGGGGEGGSGPISWCERTHTAYNKSVRLNAAAGGGTAAGGGMPCPPSSNRRDAIWLAGAMSRAVEPVYDSRTPTPRGISYIKLFRPLLRLRSFRMLQADTQRRGLAVWHNLNTHTRHKNRRWPFLLL